MLLAVDTGQRAGPNDPGDKDRDLKMLLHQLCHLQAKQRKLERELQRYKPFADYLRKVLERIPKGCSDAEKPEAAGLEALVRRYGKLLTASREAQKQLDAFCQMTRAAHEALESLEDSRKALLPGRLLSYMQVAIHNMAQQCCPPAHGIPTGMGLFSQLDLIQAFILDKMETVRMISLLTEPRVCWAGDSLRDKSLRKHPRPFRKWPMNQATSPRTPFPSGQASECSSLS
ncbi:PREDICTED: putative uncharacterized protein encoded by LINC00521 isoform X3 [Chinchilla lanigera]|uniref:putative uncharacterized protein encoded by LINC00521 isoform X3 n=1 Tax=Chinchilla lanigera TaxID=34839 RepID=UPI00038EF252|nr:PREDICTED: putative uncharacterized protein encoded by LINC00521 isoform X3 [Chinchilla lanigera]